MTRVVRPKALKGREITITDDPSRPEDGSTYSTAEVSLLAGCNGDDLVAVDALKRVFGGTLVEVRKR